MKKQRKIGPLSNTATFTSQFILKSTQMQKEERHKKFTTTFSHFKQHLLQEESKNRESKEFSKQKRPIVEQLKFIVNNKEDDFKAPRSLSKRSNSKSHMEDDKRKLQKLNNQIFEQFYQQIKVDKQRKKSTAYMWDMVTQKKFKQKSMQNTVKQKIEKTALEKFKDAISNENEEVQNKINEKNAEALYMLLKTGRSRNIKNRYDNTEDIETQQKRPKHIPTQPNDRKQKQGGNALNVEEFKEKCNQGVKNQKNRPPSAKIISTEVKQKIEIKKVYQVPKVLQQKKNRKESIQMKSKTSIKQMEVKEKPKPINNVEIVQKQQTLQSHESFTQSLSVQSRKNINEIEIKKDQKKQIIVQQVKKQYKVDKKQIKINERDLEKKETIKQATKFTQPSKQIKNDPSSINKKDFDQKNKKLQIQISRKQQKNKKQLFDDLPAGYAIDKVQKKKSEEVKKPIQIKQQKKQSFNIKQHDIQKILTSKYFQSKQNTNKPAALAPPPKLSNSNQPPKQNAPKKNYNLAQVNQDQLEVVQWNGKPKIQTKKQQKNKVQDHPKKQQIKNKQPETKNQVQQQKIQGKNQCQETQNKINSQQNQSQQESLDQVLDELVFYTQRMEDIGQYRVNSKDLYNDKSIDKQLVKNYKICSYYMAHQFLYLTQILLQLIKGQQINRDYYTISAQQLIQLQKEDLITNQIQNLDRNVQESKKLLKKCYEQCKPYLQKAEQILCLDGHTNYYKKCCSMLTKQFKKMLELLASKPDSELIQKRCCYLIEMFCVLKMFNSQNLKDFEELDEIADYREHIQTYKHLLIGI